MCGRNLVGTGRDGIIVNNIVKASALGGALGINYAEVSDWQLSKLYIWDYHLCDVDFRWLHLHCTLRFQATRQPEFVGPVCLIYVLRLGVCQ